MKLRRLGGSKGDMRMSLDAEGWEQQEGAWRGRSLEVEPRRGEFRKEDLGPER